ncbi:MAG: GNAT family N-acetyltransferase [Pseudomonadota bacterium]
MSFVISSDRIALRRFDHSDIPALRAVFRDPEVMQFSAHGVQGDNFISSWIDKQHAMSAASESFGRMAIIEKATGDLCGYAGLMQYPDRCAPHEFEISYRLVRKQWGRGLATECARLQIDYGFSRPEHERALAYIEIENWRSLKVIERLNMPFERELPEQIVQLENEPPTHIGPMKLFVFTRAQWEGERA